MSGTISSISIKWRLCFFLLSEGRVFVNVRHSHNYSLEDIIKQNPNLLPGGTWRPNGCVARHRVAVVIPYRDRMEHLQILLSHLHPILQRQQLDYTVIVVEQVRSKHT